MRPLTAEDYREIWNRRKWWFFGSAFLVAALTCLVAAMLPNQYKSTSLILLEGPAVSQETVKPLNPTDVDAEIQSLQQEVLSRTRLEPVVRELQLVPQGVPIPDSTIDAVKGAVEVKIMNAETGMAMKKGSAYGFTVSFTASNPQLAQKVDNELASFFVAQKLKLDEQKAQETQRFIEEQFNAATKTLLEKQGRLEAFQQRYRGQLPMDEQLIVQQISRLQSQLQGNQQILERDRQATTETAPVAQQSALTELQNHLQSLEGKLADLQSRYTAAHPDTIKTKEEITRVRSQIAAEIAEPTGAGTNKTSQVSAAHNQELDRAKQAEITALEKDQGRLNQQMAALQGNLQSIPAHEQEFDELKRDYSDAKAAYDKLQAKLQESQLASNVALGLQGERFRIQDSASLPDLPSAPERWKINLGGLAGALLLGLVLAGGLEFADSSMKSDRDVEYYLEVSNLATVPELRTPTEVQEARRKRLVWRFAGSLVVLLLLAVLGYLYFLRK